MTPSCVIFAPGSRIPRIDDSKLAAATRERLAAEIKETAALVPRTLTEPSLRE